MNVNENIPVVLFTYKRLDKVKKCLNSLKRTMGYEKIDIYIFADGWKSDEDKKDVLGVQEYLTDFVENEGLEKKIILKKSQINKGLAKSVINGVTDIIDQYDRVIVIEDDLVFSSFFLEYMRDALDFYAEDKEIWSISGYTPPIKIRKAYGYDVYLSYRGSSWGWATWKDRWKKVDWSVSDYNSFLQRKDLQKVFNRGGNDLTPMLIDQMEGNIDSWAIRWCYSQSKQDMLTVYPRKTLVWNDGVDGSGTHGGVDNYTNGDMWDRKPEVQEISLDKRINRQFYYYYSDTLWKKVKRNLNIKDIIRLIKRTVKTT